MQAQLLRAEMVKRKITQGKLAKEVGMSQNSMSRKLNGKRHFTVEEATKISLYLQLENPSEIFLT